MQSVARTYSVVVEAVHGQQSPQDGPVHEDEEEYPPRISEAIIAVERAIMLLCTQATCKRQKRTADRDRRQASAVDSQQSIGHCADSATILAC